MAQKIKIGDVDVELPAFNFDKFGKFIPIILILIIASFSFYTVEANENAVVLRLGKYSHTTLPGLRFKIPFVDQVYRVQVDKQFKREFGFTILFLLFKSPFTLKLFSSFLIVVFFDSISKFSYFKLIFSKTKFLSSILKLKLIFFIRALLIIFSLASLISPITLY